MPLWSSGYRNLLPNRRRMMEAGASVLAALGWVVGTSTVGTGRVN